jgi:hypothetical protein
MEISILCIKQSLEYYYDKLKHQNNSYLFLKSHFIYFYLSFIFCGTSDQNEDLWP